MNEIEFAVDHAGIRLAGTLASPAPAGAFPVVIMLHGSGPLDRNENFGRQKLDVFNALAAELASRGIASFRYDKRGCGASTGDYRQAGHADFVADAVTCFDAIRAHPSAKPGQVYLLGHSEGALTAPEVSLIRPEVAGLVLLSPFVQRLEAILLQQAENGARDIAAMPGFKGVLVRLLVRLFGSPVEKQRKLIARAKADTHLTGKGLPPTLGIRWLREMLELDPETVFRAVARPMLLIGGGKDLQCDPADVARIAAMAGGECEAHVIVDMTHLLRREAGRASFLTYPAQLKAPLHGEMMAIVGDWLARQIRA